MSDDLHPFSLIDNSPHTAERVAEKLEKRVQSFEKIAADCAIQDRKETAQKLRNQIKPLAVNVKAWWLSANESLLTLKVDIELQEWLIHILLPVVYWYHQRHKTQNSESREKYQLAWEKASETLKSHTYSATLSESELQRWLTWSEWIVQQFHRSSSAVEGRNGCLSKMYQNGRGLSKSRLKALTVIHNYGLKRQWRGVAIFAKACFGHPSPSKRQKLNATANAFGAPDVLRTCHFATTIVNSVLAS